MSAGRTIYYSSARCGAGKTHWAIKLLAERRMGAILAVDRKEVAEDRAEAIRVAGEKAGLHPHVEIIISDDGDDGAAWRGSVARRITDAAAAHAGDQHVVLIITHAGLRLADLSGFIGWTLIIDEVPSVFEHIVEDTGAMLTWLESNYELGPEAPDGGHPIRFKGAFSPGDLAKPGSRHWQPFHQMVLSGEARCDLGAWTEKERWSAWRRMDVAAHLAAFEGIYMLGDSFWESETRLIMALDPAVSFAEIIEIALTDKARVWRRREVVVEFFLAGRKASDSLFSDPKAKPLLRTIGQHIAANSSNDHLWSCNDKIAPMLKGCVIPGHKVQPVQAGSNAYDQATTVSMIYSAKPTPEVARLMAAWGITADQLVASREFNAIRQFAMRSNARVPESIKPLLFRVADKDQADDLGRYLEERYGFSVRLEHVDVGEEVPIKGKRGRPPRQRPLTLEEEQAASRRSSAKHRAKVTSMIATRVSDAICPLVPSSNPN